jgi:hypothetical protein
MIAFGLWHQAYHGRPDIGPPEVASLVKTIFLNKRRKSPKAMKRAGLMLLDFMAEM